MARFAAVLALLSLAACGGGDVPTPESGGPTLPEGSGIGWWSGQGDSGCGSAKQPRPQDRPSPQAGAEHPPIYLAFSRVRLGSHDPAGNLDSGAWRDIGLDLDDRCTNSSTCTLAPDNHVACKGTIVSPDGNQCRDNNFGRYQHDVATLPDLKQYGLSEVPFNCGLTIGLYNILIRVTGYNGKANDDSVRIDLYPSPGLESPSGFDCTVPEQSKLSFLPSDPFLIDQDSVVAPAAGPDLPDAKVHSIAGYVREGYLVAFLPDDTLYRFPAPVDQIKNPIRWLPLVLEQSVLLGRLQAGSEGYWTLTSGTIAGRARKNDMILAFRQVGLCEDNPLYKVTTSYLTTSLDVLASGEVDETQSCDALSVAIAFEAKQATPGALAKVAPLVECPK